MNKQLHNLFKFILITYIGLTGIISFSQSKIKDATIVSSVISDENALLELESNNKGFLPPRMTTAQRDLIPDPIPTGLIIYNITKNCIEFYNNTLWYNVCEDNPPVVLPKLDCASAVLNPAFVAGGQVYAGTATLSYTDGNGKPYNAASIPSTGVTGLTATIKAGRFANGSGTITFSIKGTPHSNGIASFSINLGGIVCTLECKVIPNQLRIGGWGDFNIASQYMPNIRTKLLNIANLGIEGPAPTITSFNPSLTGDVLKEQYEILNVTYTALSAAQANIVDYVNLGGVLYVWCDGTHNSLWNAFGGTGGISMGSGSSYAIANSDPINSGIFGTVPNGTLISGAETFGYIPATGAPSGSRIFATTVNGVGVGGVIMAGYGGRVVFIWDEGLNRAVSAGNQVTTPNDIFAMNIWAYLIDKARGL